jgi:hypothetical protein
MDEKVDRPTTAEIKMAQGEDCRQRETMAGARGRDR